MITCLLSHSFCRSKVHLWLSWVLCTGSHQAAVMVSAGLCSHQRLDWGGISAYFSLGWLAELISWKLQSSWRLCLSWPSRKNLPLGTSDFREGSCPFFKRHPDWARPTQDNIPFNDLRAQWLRILLTSEKSLHICHILSIRSRPQVSPTLKGRGPYTGKDIEEHDHTLQGVFSIIPIPPTTQWARSCYCPQSTVRKARFVKIKWLVWSHQTRRWLSWDSNTECLIPEPCMVISCVSLVRE